MKTLDEVIKANECCDHGELDSRCEDCPYNGIGACCAEREFDALHYLKDMKNLAEDYDILYNKYWREFNQQQANPPLTWQELQQMEGKPVWIEFLNDEGNWNGEWCLVESSNNLICEILRCQKAWWGLRKMTLNKTWQAYKKERFNTEYEDIPMEYFENGGI